MILEPGPDWDRPFPKDRSGLQALPGEGVLTVLFVAPGSPAERDGWNEGDRITAIDGRAVGPDDFETLHRWGEARAGTRVVLTFDGGQTRTLVLRDY